MRTLILALALTTLLGSAAHAADIVYETIDAYGATLESSVEITGVLQGTAVATTEQYNFYYSTSANADTMSKRCDALAAIMMLKPGKFLLKLTPSPYSSQLDRCTLVKR